MNIKVITLISIVLLILDFYIAQVLLGLWKNWSTTRRKRFKIIWFGLSFAIILSIFANIYFKNIPQGARTVILLVFFITSISKIVFLLFALSAEIKRGIEYLFSLFSKNDKDTPISENNKITRSDFLVKAGIGAAAIPLATLSWGILSGAYDYQIRRVKLKLANLPSNFHGIKLAQISDIHSGSFYHQKSVLGGVEMLMKEKADFIFFTGDLVNNVAPEMRDYFDIFSKIKAPLGVYSVLGNHDYGDYFFRADQAQAKAQNLAQVKKIHKDMGWDLLLNTHKRLKVGNDEIGILGIENWGAGRFAKYGRMDLAVQNTDDLPVKLLLSHDPSHWRAQVLPDYPQIDAAFAGHTHGMQMGIRLPHFQWSPIQYVYKEWAGLYQEQTQQLYVNVGYGFLGYPGRIGMLPEITIFELEKG